MKGADSRPATKRAPAAKKASKTKAGANPSSPVLVLGSGLHNAAGTPALDWPAAVALVFGEKPAPGGEAVALAWEARLVDQASGKGRKKPSVAEKGALEKLACMLDGRYSVGTESPLHARLRSGGIADLVVFNFDRSLHDDFDAASWRDERRAPDLGGTRVWHPHGHTGRPARIVFGTRRYGMEIKALEAAREDYWKNLGKKSARLGTDPAPTHWLHTFLSRREVHLIGLGLRPEEWTLWWALTQRARRFARAGEAATPKTVAHVYHDPNQADGHDTWRKSALRSLGVEESRFGPKESKTVWEQVLNLCEQGAAR
jgi:hypothetical protein